MWLCKYNFDTVAIFLLLLLFYFASVFIGIFVLFCYIRAITRKCSNCGRCSTSNVNALDKQIQIKLDRSWPLILLMAYLRIVDVNNSPLIINNAFII
jgi:hypothetical protein